MVDCKTGVLRTPTETDKAILWPLPPDDWATQLGLTHDLPEHSSPAPPCEIVHVWAASLDVRPETLKRFAASLALDEQERAARFHFPRHRDRFTAGRGMLRSLLAHYLGLEPHALKFGYGPHGKPVLTGSALNQSLSFNLAHSEDLLLIAVTRSGMIGVDVEQVRAPADAEGLVARFFSANECAKFRTLTAEQQPTAFFSLWTRKEAWLKATGEGITHLLNQVEVSFLPTEPTRLLRLPDAYANSSFWSLCELAPRPGFAAALAVAENAPVIHCWRYQGP